MRKKLFVSVAIVLGLAPASALAAITLDARSIDFLNITTAANGDIVITTSEGDSPPQCTDDPNNTADPCGDGYNQEPPPQCTDDPNNTSDPCDDGFIPPTNPGECGEVASNVTVTAPLNWAQPGNTPRISLGRDEVKATPFTTTSNFAYEGQIGAVSTTGNSHVQRRMWISECPGGAPLPHATSKCESTGTSNTTVRWTQSGLFTPIRCGLDTNTSYYFNIRNLDCDSSACDVYRGVFTNKQP